jgi:SAM-dependent methyltransferase
MIPDNQEMRAAETFDQYADTYDADLNAALSASGESKEYFAQRRIEWLQQCAQRTRERPQSALDYGCGIGDTSVLLARVFGLGSVVGLDVSERSLEIARLRYGSDGCRFSLFRDYTPKEQIDLAYCNGTFHHIPLNERAATVAYIRNCLRPGGLFALWENNPWNPGTRYVMAQCAFDQDAITLTPPESVRLLKAGGFEIIGVSYLFFFPRMLKLLRFLEPYFSRIPVGGQYQVLCRKPSV